MLALVRIEPGTSYDPFWCLPDLASVNWGILSLTFGGVQIDFWLLDLDDLAEINRTWLYKDPRSLSLTSNAQSVSSGRWASEWIWR